jgi:hypothetical protein
VATFTPDHGITVGRLILAASSNDLTDSLGSGIVLHTVVFSFITSVKHNPQEAFQLYNMENNMEIFSIYDYVKNINAMWISLEEVVPNIGK